MANPRRLAVNTLVKIEKEGKFSNLAVKEALAETELTAVDRAFATALIYGVLDRKITLDFILSKFLKDPIKKLKPFTLAVLRVSLYQIRFMDKVPESAAVNEGVKLMKNSKESRNQGLVNAVLRNILRSGVELPQENTPEALSVRYSVPAWIAQSFISDYGLEDTVKLLEESLKPPPLVLKVNTVKTNIQEVKSELERQGIEVKNGLTSDTLEIVKGMDISQNELYRKGFIYAQDYASSKAVGMLKPRSGQRVLDMCAAPGGKTFTAAALMENKGEIISCDLYPKRVELIEKSAKRLGLGIIKTAVADALEYNPDLGEFDCVICDVPCSGLGVIRRKPEIKYTALEDLTSLEEIQKKILFNGFKYLKKGGRLMYSTCTLRLRENENLVISAKKEYNDLCVIEEHSFMPHKDGTDGFYCAILEKQ